MRTRARIGLIAGAMAVAVVGRGCVTTPPPPVAESVVAGSSTHGTRASMGAGDAAALNSPVTSMPVPRMTAPGVTAPSVPESGVPESGVPESGAPEPSVPDASVPPPPVPNNANAPNASPAAGTQTPDERRAALDKQLDDSLGAFDAKLHKEQQRSAEERDARQATVSAATVAAATAANAGGSSGLATADNPSAVPGSSTASGGGAGPSAPNTAAADGARSSTGTGAGGASATAVPGTHRGTRGETRSSRAGDLKSDKGSGGAASASGNGAPATIIPDGNDDDIVARRLRKAAELETDPELKDKLWKEYVEYKKNTQVR